MSSIRHKSSCGQRSDSSESDRIEVRLESNPRFYECVKRFKSNEDLFISNYRPTGDKFVLRRTNLEQMDRLDFIANENRLTRLLKHKNLLPFLCSFVNNNELWTITPFAEFGSVSLLSKPTGMPEMAIAFVVRDVLSALEYLHRRGIVHRSIRGSHILVTAPNGRCLLSGLKYSTSVMIDGKWHTAIHQYPTNCLPNLNWLAPEVLEQNLLGYNSKSDIYSLGITLCELANGCVPFEDVELTEMLLDKLTANFPRPLDSTCDEINKIPTEDMSPEIRQKYEIYKNRTFSASFHRFTIDLCLNFDPFERPTASQLLDHSFVKQTKKCSHNLLSLIPNIEPIDCIELVKNNIIGDSLSEENNTSKMSSSDESYIWNF